MPTMTDQNRATIRIHLLMTSMIYILYSILYLHIILSLYSFFLSFFLPLSQFDDMVIYLPFFSPLCVIYVKTYKTGGRDAK